METKGLSHWEVPPVWVITEVWMEAGMARLDIALPLLVVEKIPRQSPGLPDRLLRPRLEARDVWEALKMGMLAIW